VAAKYILTALAGVFLILGVRRLLRHGARHPQARAWLLVGGIFSVVSAWLWLRA
jgi:uncharacterized membrane protein HdeD (DUF308 family)